LHCAPAREALEEDLRELGVELADLRLRQRHVPHEERTPRQVERARDERLVHRQRRVAVASDADLVAERLGEDPTEDDPEILGRVVPVDRDVALRAHHEIEEPVLGELLDHVGEERQRRRDAMRAVAVEIELDLDPCLVRVPLERGATRHRGDHTSLAVPRRELGEPPGEPPRDPPRDPPGPGSATRAGTRVAHS
jgi:hypothetical protein